MILDHIEPKPVMHFFEVISAIPRGSKKEQKISNFLVQFAKDRNLEVRRDKQLNLVICKPATKGYEHVPPIILQGHMDMVWEKNNDIEHDFETQGINLIVDGDFVKAKGTTLGADNGIAVAMALAILDSDTIPHPALEVLITTEEEIGLAGAEKLDPSILTAKTLINIDSEEEGQIYSSCAGGCYSEIIVPIQKKESIGDSFTISLTGLKGGHSGMQIQEQKGNANKLIARLLFYLEKQIPSLHLIDIKGGSKDNAIPREASATIVIDTQNTDILKQTVDDFNKKYKESLAFSDPDVEITYHKAKNHALMIDKKGTHDIILAMMVHPNGVQSMSLHIPLLVETSINLGVVTTDSNSVHLRSLARSSKEADLHEILDTLSCLAIAIKAKHKPGNVYSSWEFNPHSKIRDIAIEAMTEQYGTPPEIKAIHAGLECGLLGKKIGKDADMISIGPNLYDVHSPDEKMEISSVQKTYKSLLSILEKTKDFY